MAGINESTGEESNEAPPVAAEPALVLRFAHNIIEHLGLKLYQNRPTNVLAELVSNAWDAYAKHVWIDVDTAVEKGDGRFVAVMDDGSGMDLAALAHGYLVIGLPKDRSEYPQRGDRRPMGRKGIGKLAPFGIAGLIDVLTISGHNEASRRVTWMRLDAASIMASEAEPGGLGQYEPEVVLKAAAPNQIDPGLDSTGSVRKFVDRIGSGTGTLVLLRRVSLQREIAATAVQEAMGRRFTVTLARPDFRVLVNGGEVTEAQAFPVFELRIPSSGKTTETVNGRNVSYWVGFVERAAWAQDEAGVGVYAHGKIAQDRPHVFGLKGREIYTRYMYGVVEADWLDDLPQDIVSTDRTSIDWEQEDAARLRSWGEGKVRSWIDSFVTWRGSSETRRVRERVEQRIASRELPSVSESERRIISDMLAEITPQLGKDEEALNSVTAAVMRAYLHRPMRAVLKQAWDRLAQERDPAAPTFLSVIDELSRQVVPESLSLAVVFAQRAYALSILDDLINRGTEPDLQRLIEHFPWILRPDMEKLTANQHLKTMVQAAEAEGLIPVRTLPRGGLDVNERFKPDFVFLSDTHRENIFVVEIKSPQEELTISNREQLNAYMVYMEQQYPQANRRGLLVGTMPANLEITNQRVEHLSWTEIFIKSRYGHLDLLASMLRTSAPSEDDDRVQQIKEFGGAASWQLLERLAETDEDLRDLFSKVPRKPAVAIPALPGTSATPALTAPVEVKG